MDIHNNFINGRWVPSVEGKTYPQKNPADLTIVTGIWQESGVKDVKNAVDSAQQAFKNWSSLTIYKRAEYLKVALTLMRERANKIAEILTAENGKTLAESKTEINSAIKEMDFQINEGLYRPGEVVPSAQEGVMAYSIRRPLGVVGVIAPWNFPFNVPARKCVPALISGNTCVLKPAYLTPGTGAAFVRLFEDAGLPEGVLNFVTGNGSVAGNALVTSPNVKAISFTGSTNVGMGIQKAVAENLVRTQLEMGGKNAMVVLSDAALKKAAKEASRAAFACSGQWCTSTSRVIVEQSVLEEFLSMLMENVKKIRVGNGAVSNAGMGPVCGEAQLKSVLEDIEKGKSEGAKILYGGNRLETGDYKNGCFIEPTIFTEVTPDMYIAREEIFGPVLSVMAVADFEQAIAVANSVKYGLSSSIFTNDLQKAHMFIEQTDVGMTHVNMSTAYKEPQLSFGGVKLSGFGIPEAGHTGIEFFTEHKVIYIKNNP
ncbi:aldehyde dehydrogenase family protein [Mariniphaga sediminis]|jgi:aldehyde dehydrogenase (NAD+)|uniref:Aldehyde dehydrogenase family protein n=1 Tax=Mariniphaga sediminis TaxID=1628158 RepID=A0A399CW60_9BACT|nr:aldehyde dehydrogenase family protein [Mariniphaga sediminis]RIH63985.1 aldehyde dehydrogenase family protein [Mariniphaga sediminis]